jgi:hypothetical protein
MTSHNQIFKIPIAEMTTRIPFKINPLVSSGFGVSGAGPGPGGVTGAGLAVTKYIVFVVIVAEHG